MVGERMPDKPGKPLKDWCEVHQRRHTSSDVQIRAPFSGKYFVAEQEPQTRYPTRAAAWAGYCPTTTYVEAG